MALCMSMSQTFFLLTQWLPIFSTKFTIFPEIKVPLVAKNIIGLQICSFISLQQLQVTTAASYKGFYVWKKTLGSSVTLPCFHSNPCGLIHYFQTASVCGWHSQSRFTNLNGLTGTFCFPQNLNHFDQDTLQCALITAFQDHRESR